MGVEAPSIAERYRWAVASFLDLAGTFTADDWATPVPCTPSWTVRDVLSHVAGIPDDALNGRLDGVTTDPWTAAQVERNRGLTVDDLIGRWREQTDPFAEAIDAIGQHLPPFDCHTHEHDVRHALGRPGNRENAVVELAARGLIEEFELPLVVELVDGTTLSSDVAGVAPVVLSGVSPFEVFRSRVGRRSRAQVDAYDWTADADAVDAVIERWFRFGPSEVDIVE
jgi:hypothetical protein